MELVTTPSEALARYRKALTCDSLVQKRWHDQARDGRHLACALGILGPDVESAAHCPASIMPGWLAEMVPIWFDTQEFDAAKDWGLRFYTELDRLQGKVPDSVYSAFNSRHTGVGFGAEIIIDCLRRVPTPK